MLGLGLLTLSSISLRGSEVAQAQQKAQANARLALLIAIGQLQKYAGPDQRVTARADITDPNWHDLHSPLANPFYTYVWDVSGSELDLSPNNQPLTTATGSHRPGMDPGHQFSKKPAILVSGNSDKSLTDANGKFTSTVYPTGYITGETKLSDLKLPSITLVRDSSLLKSQAEEKTPSNGVSVPLVNVADSGSYGWWIGDESVKARIDLGNRHAPQDVAATMLAQRHPVNLFRDGLDSTLLSEADAGKWIDVPTAGLGLGSKMAGPWSYSPDLTCASQSLLTDVRSGGLKQDFTYALYNAYQPFNASTGLGMTPELQNSATLMDRVEGQAWVDASGVSGTAGGGLQPTMSALRNYATLNANPLGTAVSIGTNNIAPVLSQVQTSIHCAYQPTSGTKFKVYFSIFPALSLWNPYDVPIRIDKPITIEFRRRSATMNWWLYKFAANYSLKGPKTTTTKNNVFDPNPNPGGGWLYQMRIDADTNLILPPGKSMVFSPEAITTDHNPVAPTPNGSRNFVVKIKPGWNPGKGLLFNLDGVEYDAAAYCNPDGTGKIPYPQITFGIGAINDNVIWHASIPGKTLSYWARLNNQIDNSTSVYFDAPLTIDVNQDTRGNFPRFLHKCALRMGEDYLTLKPSYRHPKQTSLLFPYMASFNPRAIYHTGMGDSPWSNTSSNLTQFWSSDGTEASPSLMGGVYDYQNSQSIYTLPTTDASNTFSYIGSGYNGPSEEMILVETSSGLPPNYPNAASGGLISPTQFNSSDLMTGGGGISGVSGSLDYNWLATSNYPALPIGNSLADFRLNVTQKPLTLNGLKLIGSIAKFDTQNKGSSYGPVNSMHVDASYLLNERFYDRYFFSTIPQQGSYSATAPLIHSRLTPTVDDIVKLRRLESSQYLTLKGGFNINSTSVSAWELLLSSSLGVPQAGADGKEVVFSPRNRTTQTVSPGNLTQGDAATGSTGLKLSNSEVRTLAEEIVRQVKRRGPFPSVSAFVNRTNQLQDILRGASANDTNGTPDVRFAGALQAALDSIPWFDTMLAQKSVDGEKDYVNIKNDTNGDRFYTGAAATRKSANAQLPGVLKQSDLLRQIDSVITARGDTFVIRAAGTSKDKGGKIRAIAVCEATVQRITGYVDRSQAPDTQPYIVTVNADNTRTFLPQLTVTNQRFGRRFEVRSFQWLPSKEVSLTNIQ